MKEMKEAREKRKYEEETKLFQIRQKIEEQKNKHYEAIDATIQKTSESYLNELKVIDFIKN